MDDVKDLHERPRPKEQGVSHQEKGDHPRAIRESGRGGHALRRQLCDPAAVKHRVRIAVEHIADVAGDNHEEAHVRHLEEKHPKAQRGGEHCRAGVGVVTDCIEGEPDGDRPGSLRLQPVSPRLDPRLQALAARSVP